MPQGTRQAMARGKGAEGYKGAGRWQVTASGVREGLAHHTAYHGVLWSPISISRER